MVSAPIIAHCPECGAPVKTGDRQCWMCYREVEWDGGTIKAAVSGPFAGRPARPRIHYQTNPWAIVGIVLAALAMVPAACIAFFVTCLVTLSATPRQADNWALLTSSGAGFIVLVGFCVLIGMLGTRVSRVVRT
jgi:hypothetical protein